MGLLGNYSYNPKGSPISGDGQSPGQAFSGKEDDDYIAEEIESRRTTFLTETVTMRRQWLLEGAFARGQQFNILHSTEDRLIHLQEPPGRKQIQVDVIGPWIEHMVAKLTQAMPKFEAMPEDMDASSVSAARMGNALLGYYWDNWRFSEDYINLATLVINFGNAFIYLNYIEDGSRYKSRNVVDSTTGNPAVDENGELITEKTSIGDIEATVLPPQNLICPLDTNKLDDKPWVIIYQRQPMDYFEIQYGDKGKEVGPETHARDYYGLWRIAQNSSGGSQSQGVEYANEIIYFQKPSDINTDGMVVVVANGKILSRNPWPYTKLVSGYPIEHFHLRKEAEEFFARSWIERQIPLQKLYNLLWSILAENADDQAHQKLLVHNTSGINENDIVDMNQMLEWGGNIPPSYMQLGDMPSYFQNAFPLIEKKIQDVQNYHGASLGSSVSGVRSDVHAQNLQDQDLLPLTVLDELMRISFERMGEKILTIAAEKLTEERVIAFTGEGKRMMYENFKGEMLGDSRTVKVRMTNLWMRNKGMTRQTIMQRFQMGGITDQFGRPDAAKLDRLLEWDMPDTAREDLQIHTERAYLENDRIMRGGTEPTPVTMWQDQKVHISVHQDFMNSNEYMEVYEAGLSGDEQAAKTAAGLEQHTEEHLQIYQQQLMAAMPAPEQKPGQANREGKPQQSAPAEKT